MSILIDDLQKVEMRATRDGFGEGVEDAARKDHRVVVACADLKESLRLLEFGRVYPDRFVEVGVAEQNLIGVSAGMALSGKIVFAASYAVFSPGRSWDQVRVSVAFSNANVKIIGGHTGLGVGPDGATHQALEDIALMRVLPNMVVIVPADAEQARKATIVAAAHEGPVYIRLTRPKTAVFTSKTAGFEIGKGQVLRSGKDLTIVGCGPILYQALLVAEELSDRYDIEVINMHTIKPIDEPLLVRSAKKTGKVITIEEHQTAGGLGGAVSEVLSDKCPVRVRRIGVDDSFGESGEPDQLYEKYHMSKRWLVKEVEEMML